MGYTQTGQTGFHEYWGPQVRHEKRGRTGELVKHAPDGPACSMVGGATFSLIEQLHQVSGCPTVIRSLIFDLRPLEVVRESLALLFSGPESSWLLTKTQHVYRDRE